MAHRKVLFTIVGTAALTSLLLGLVWMWRDSDHASDAFDVRAEHKETPAVESGDLLLERSRWAFQQKDYSAAELLASRVPPSAREATTAFRLAGEAAVYQGKFVVAVKYFDQMSDTSSPDFLDGNVMAGEILLAKHYRMSEAEQRFRRVLEIDNEHTAANVSMSNLLNSSARRREAVPYILELMRQGYFVPDQLIVLGGEDRLYIEPASLKQCYASDPKSLGVLLGMSQGAINRGDMIRAKELLGEAVKLDSSFGPAQSRLGRLLVLESNPERFLNWHEQLSPTDDQNPDVWLVRGEWAQQQGQIKVAIRCYWEAVRRDSNLRTAVFQLSKLLASQGDHQRGSGFLRRSKELQELKELEARLNVEGPSIEVIGEIAAQMELLGRLWEAWGWYLVALGREPDLEWLRNREVALRTLLRGNPPQVLASANPALETDLSDYPLPDWKAESPVAVPPVGPNASRAAVSFKNVASTAGLEFSYFSSPSRSAVGRKMYELTGGGVAVMDFDADGWPDIYLTQGCSWPPREHVNTHLDRIFHNRGNGTLVDVTDQAGLRENRFSQGAAVGDFDNDGFCDILVGNIGCNRLYRNNGDGTFSDVTIDAGLDGDSWTTSCLVADINGDSLPDLYEVNYLQGNDVFQRVCRRRDGRARMCKPTVFEGSQDRLHLNLGNGRFEDVSEQAGIRTSGGKGLGIVAADVDGSGSLSLFVANDAVANFFFQNQTPKQADAPLFVEQAYENGLAFNGDGHAEGCMGIAIGDSNGDQRLDLFVTNFYAESNTLYIQNDGAFYDATRQAGLVEASSQMLGFGTQFMDGDLDGNLDLIVTNGHIDDFQDEGIPFEMPPQYFHNQGDGHFQPLHADLLGEYFAGRYVGRGLARLDWNRDGLEDFVVSHLDAPVALLENMTVNAGHYIVVKLRGTSSSRDAIGTTVTVEVGGRVLVRQLTAGDGYQASNQHQLLFGLGAASRINRLLIRWPSGVEEEFKDIPTDVEFLFIEGQPLPFSAQHRLMRL